MPNLYGGNPFQDVNEEERYRQEEIERAGLAAAQARALGLAPSSAQQQGSNNAAFMSTLGGLDAAAASPYYARQAYGRGYVQQQQPNVYGALQSPADTMYARRASYGYAASPDQAYHSQFNGIPSASSARDFAFYGGQRARDQAMIDRAYIQQREEEEAAALIAAASARKTASQLSLLSQQSPQVKAAAKPPVRPKSAPSSAKAGGRGGRGKGGRSSPGRGGRGRGGRGRGKSTASRALAKSKEAAKAPPVEPPNGKWFSGCVALGLPEDKYWLSELQVYLRANFAEAFGATEADIAAPMHGRNKPIALDQVGIRCMHCKDDPPSERGQQATSYPSLISGIYNSVQQMLRLHFDCCLSMPADIRQKIESLKVSSSARGGRKQYWIDSAKRLGLTDTPYGIHFGRDPTDPLPPLEGPMGPPGRKNRAAAAAAKAAAAEEARKAKAEAEQNADGDSPVKEEEMKAGKAIQPIAHLPPEQLYPLVLPGDQDLISDYLYLTLEQMQPANLTEADKVGCYKGRGVGFPGLACMHCVGQAGCGRYFPATEASLSQTTTSQTIMNHVRNCRRCPIEIRENLELMKRARMGPDGKRADKPKHGGRKVFFHRLWCRIQRIPMDSEDETPARKKKQWGRRKAASSAKARRKAMLADDRSTSDIDDSDRGTFDDSDASSGEEETETEHSDMSDDESDGSVAAEDRKPRAKRVYKKKEQTRFFTGVVRLAKSDDPHWMTEMNCFARNELLELFSRQKDDTLNGYSGRKEPSVGQVGIRCVFCARLPKAEQPAGSVHFPELLSSVDTKIGDMIRLHFPSCPAMPDEVKETFRSLRVFGPKVADSHQYWIDSARDIGVADIPAEPDGWGISFRRDPMQPSPADDIDRENAGAETYSYGKSSLIRGADRGACTDQVMLLLRQVKACRFKKTDRRGGPGSRSRDRVLGFPGLCCKHCDSSKNNIGRYFPVSAKNLTDHTANSLQLHLQSCSRCPEEVKSSLAYLSHRSIIQKAELRGSWKKTFFKRVWDRLHVERAWDNGDGNLDDGTDEASASSGDNHFDEGGSPATESASDDEEAAISGMEDLIKAAAIWLSEQEAPNDSLSRTRVGRGARALPSSLKRPSPFNPKARGRTLPSSKRRRMESDS